MMKNYLKILGKCNWPRLTVEYKKAQQRVKLSRLKNIISLKKIEKGQIFPFPENFFDKVIIESVLAIQDDSALHFLLSEIRRVLKPSGMFYLNETVWMPSIAKEEIEKARQRLSSMTESEKEILYGNALLGLPGSEERFTPEQILAALKTYEHIDVKKLKQHLFYFLKNEC